MQKLLYLLVLLLATNNVFAEKVITAKEDLPDAYFGLKVGAVISPAFGYRLRDSSSGTSNAKKDDRTGFSMPWTLFMISKEWEEKKVTVEFWGELIRSSVVSSDTTADNGNKSNPYILGIRRASVKKNFELGIFNFSLIFGIHELPHVYTQWNGYWKWRYVDRAPMESLGFSPQPADLGASFLMQAKGFSAHIGIVNGEGYRDLQNSNSSGYDAVSRFSYEQEIQKFKIGFHLLGRAGNVAGVAGDECREGKTNCLASDNKNSTMIVRDLRYQKSQTLGAEYTMLFDRYLNLGLGFVHRKIFQGLTYDALNLSTYPIYLSDIGKTAYYLWIGGGYGDFNLIARTERGSGSNGVLGNSAGGFIFTKNSFFIEYLYSESVRFAFGGSILMQGSKVYIDSVGNTRTQTDYLNQFYRGQNLGIVEYSNNDRQLFIRSTMDF
ncbi:MAG TPA: hypothetical protein PK079_09725 [Leptospiraceae bacterium]|nr:hypothetical protein [Leptospiraceae bacterium]HMW04585.1 hypothetical protein [Leptospiraceae bacterium]HMX33262.1 hypothetical protein [Leptospiraceae bacterium]HMY30771.1 hypothetical protein [Leptospiraceae bacterium]HMZ66733.1 hypothetical protein [Leptospiraceae bacterium]